MVPSRKYVLKLFMSLKYVTANVVDRKVGRVAVGASSAEESLKKTFECDRTCNAKAATVVGEILARRLKVEGLEDGQGHGIYVDIKKELERKGFKDLTKIWAVVNALKDNGIKLVMKDNHDDIS